MPRRLWLAPMISQIGSVDRNGAGGAGGISGGSISNAFTTLMNWLRGHIGYWGEYTGTTNAFAIMTVTHNCGFTPDKIFVQRVYDAVTPIANFGELVVLPTGITDTTFNVLLMKLDGTGDVSSGNRTIWYHILPVVKER